MTPGDKLNHAWASYWLSCMGLKVVYLMEADGTSRWTWRVVT